MIWNVLAVLAWFGAMAATGWWTNQAGQIWVEHLHERGLLRRSDYWRGSVSPADIPRLRALSAQPDPDPTFELWRIRGNRRLNLVLIVALVGLALPATAAVSAWAATFTDGGAIGALLSIVAVAALVISGTRFAFEAIRYGNGEAITLYRLFIAGVPMLLLILFGALTFIP